MAPMSSLAEYRASPEEYLRLERAAETKSEYDDGVVVAMAGASERLNLIVAGLIRSLGIVFRHAVVFMPAISACVS